MLLGARQAIKMNEVGLWGGWGAYDQVEHTHWLYLGQLLLPPANDCHVEIQVQYGQVLVYSKRSWLSQRIWEIWFLNIGN